MARSYRKHLWKTQGYGTRARRWLKNYANRRIRRTGKEIPSGKAYRKYFETWDIVDWKMDYDPYIRYYHSFDGKLIARDPDPIWKWKCK